MFSLAIHLRIHGCSRKPNIFDCIEYVQAINQGPHLINQTLNHPPRVTRRFIQRRRTSQRLHQRLSRSLPSKLTHQTVAIHTLTSGHPLILPSNHPVETHPPG
jgi:hypothetical protein